jgi:hypothetical protein
MNSRFFLKFRKSLIVISFITIFVGVMIVNTPAWVLNSPLTKYSRGQLKLYNLSGSFWNGSGLLVASASSKHNKTGAVPLIHLSWKVSLGLSKYMNVQLLLDQRNVANVYLDKHGLSIDNLDISLSISQISRLSDIIDDLKIAGNLQLKAKHILIAGKQTGTMDMIAKNVSSGMSPVNPLGSYNIKINLDGGKIDIATNDDDSTVLNLNGSGTFNALTVKASVSNEKAEKMKTFITLMGIPNPDGTYNLKLF